MTRRYPDRAAEIAAMTSVQHIEAAAEHLAAVEYLTQNVTPVGLADRIGNTLLAALVHAQLATAKGGHRS